ncbi:MAG: carboxypeptidase-like regulatory domain-containing protein [Bacteroidetes bacterium]|nr:carboxypeptidase-like regulatory domain-containing protein [Bacteroidota bacterium]
MFLRFSFLCTISFFFVVTHAQFSISGKVVGSDNNLPIASANVYFNNSSKGTITNENGYFKIANFAAGRYELVVSCIGYLPKIINISSSNLSQDLVIQLSPKTEELAEVIVAPFDKDGWAKWGQLFLEFFVGTSEYANDCKLINKDAIKFRYNKKKNKLEAFSLDRLVLENNSLGYFLKYDLVRFEYDFSSYIFIYQGYPFFEEMESTKKAINKKWLTNRVNAYNGSLMHFMRSLFRNSLVENNFEVKKTINTYNPEKRRVAPIYKAELSKSSLSGDLSKALSAVSKRSKEYDSLSYYKSVMKGPDFISSIDNNIMPRDSIVYLIDSVTLGLQFSENLHISYFKKGMTIANQNNLNNLNFMNNRPTVSELTNVGNTEINIIYNGSYFPVNKLIVNGYWSWAGKIGDMLPQDYWPPKK